MVLKVYIGQYSNGGNCGIHTLGIDDSTGEIMELSHTFGLHNTIWLALSRDATRLYAARDNGISVFHTTGGTLRHISDYETNHTQPCHLSLSSDGNRLYFAEYTDATCGIIHLDTGKTLTATLSGNGPNLARQSTAHAHCAVESPDGRYVFIADLGSDSIWIFDSTNLKLLQKIPTPPGAGPRHIVFHPNGKFAYVVFELANIVIAYSYDNGTIIPIQNMPLLPDGYNGKSQAAALKISENAGFLFATNRGDDSVTGFSIDSVSGELKFIANSSLGGSWPRDFSLLPGGRIAVACLEREGEVRTYALDGNAGALKPLPYAVKMHRPVVAIIDSTGTRKC